MKGKWEYAIVVATVVLIAAALMNWRIALVAAGACVIIAAGVLAFGNPSRGSGSVSGGGGSSGSTGTGTGGKQL
jgi:hypothetical protein